MRINMNNWLYVLIQTIFFYLRGVLGFWGQLLSIEYWVTHPPCLTSPPEPWPLSLVWYYMFVSQGLGSRGQLLSIEYWVTHPPCLTSPPAPWPLSLVWYYVWVSWFRVQGSIIEYWVLSDPPHCLTSPPTAWPLRGVIITFSSPIILNTQYSIYLPLHTQSEKLNLFTTCQNSGL